MGVLKPGTPVKTANALIFNNESKKPGVEGLVVKYLEGHSHLAYYDVLFASEAEVKTLVYPGEFEVDVERLPLEKVNVAAADVKVRDTILDRNAESFVVDQIGLVIDWSLDTPAPTKGAKFAGFSVKDGETRTYQEVDDIDTHTLVALRRQEV